MATGLLAPALALGAGYLGYEKLYKPWKNKKAAEAATMGVFTGQYAPGSPEDLAASQQAMMQDLANQGYSDPSQAYGYGGGYYDPSQYGGYGMTPAYGYPTGYPTGAYPDPSQYGYGAPYYGAQQPSFYGQPSYGYAPYGYDPTTGQPLAQPTMPAGQNINPATGQPYLTSTSPGVSSRRSGRGRGASQPSASLPKHTYVLLQKDSATYRVLSTNQGQIQALLNQGAKMVGTQQGA